MSGIVGWFDPRNNLLNKDFIMKNMMDKLTHRGSNESAMYMSENIILGYNGFKPMIKNFGEYKYVIVCDGKIYNADTLKNILKGKGHVFSSNLDIEIILTSYVEWGVHCLDYFNGVFAFAIWDERNKSLFMARDHLGIKPLFYSNKNNKLLFASEMKALLVHPDIEAVIDEVGICEIFGLGPARTPGNAVFKDISEIKPGHYIFYSKDNFYEKEYWDLKSNPHKENFESTVETVKDILSDSIKRQLISDLPLCAFLSGGLDSSIISAIAAKEYKKLGKKLDTYSMEYIDNDKYFKSTDFQPEADPIWTAKMVEQIHSNHHIIYIDTPQLVETLKEAVIADDLPGMADVDSSMFLFCKGVVKQHTIALSGECADEVFGGYPWCWKEEFIKSNTFPWSRAIKERKAILSDDFKKIDLESYVEDKYNKTVNKVLKLDNETEQEHRIREIYYLNHTWFMQTLLNRTDRMSMANGLEVRVPFADKLLVEYAWDIPCSMKYYNNREKGLLRKAAVEIIPDSVIERKKSPFPKTHNPAYTKAVQKWMNTILEDSTSPLLQLIDKAKIEEIVATGGLAFTKPWYGQLMTGPQLLAYLIQINIWLKLYKIKII